jgi:hypothetical protein
MKNAPEGLPKNEVKRPFPCSPDSSAIDSFGRYVNAWAWTHRSVLSFNTTGKGHITRTVGTEDRVTIQVPISDHR